MAMGFCRRQQSWIFWKDTLHNLHRIKVCITKSYTQAKSNSSWSWCAFHILLRINKYKSFVCKKDCRNYIAKRLLVKWVSLWFVKSTFWCNIYHQKLYYFSYDGIFSSPCFSARFGISGKNSRFPLTFPLLAQCVLSSQPSICTFFNITYVLSL